MENGVRVLVSSPLPLDSWFPTLVVGINFRSAVKKCTTEALQKRLIVFDPLGKPKVRELDDEWITGLNQDVIRFDIAVGHVALV